MINPIYQFLLLNRSQNLNSGTGTPGYAVRTSTGELYAFAGYTATNYLYVYPNRDLVCNYLYDMAFYDSNRNYISGINWNGTPFRLIKTPPNAAYMRLSVPTGKWDVYYITYYQLAHPTYKDDLAKDYELETNQRFYRAKLSGKISFITRDFDYLNNAAFDSEFNLIIQRSNDMGKSWVNYFTGKFMKTDCTWNLDDKKCQVQPDPVDEYNDVLAGLEKEYNLISITPQIERLYLRKRPLIQVYLPGDSIVSCFLSGTYWEQDANATTDRNALIQTYHFALCNMLKEMNVTVNGTPTAINGLYAGKMSLQSGSNNFTGSLYPTTNTGYHITVAVQYVPPFFGIIVCNIVRDSDNVTMFNYQTNIGGSGTWDNLDFTMNAVTASGATGTARVEMATYNVYARYLLDVDTIQGLNTYALPSDDIVDYNRNYRRAIGYAINIAYISNSYSVEPTEWGRADNGRYFAPPYSIYGQRFFPIARSTWRYASIWFGFHLMDEYMERDGRKTYMLRDALPIGSCINALLKQFAPGVQHLQTAEYSQFLYGDSNPVAYGQNFRLFVTQKSNLLVGDYQQPAQKAPTTLQQFTNMLRDCFRCFWYIEDGKFKIEHINWFRNGGSYTGQQIVSIDTTKIKAVRNGKPWSFGTNEYSFDKVDMPERYQFEWMDDVTEAFEGMPIEIISKYVTPGKIEDVNVSNFTSDVDMMMLNPTNMSNDGFALFGAVKMDALTNNDAGLYPGFGGTSGTNGLTSPTYGIRPECRGQTATLVVQPYGNGTAQVVFYNGGNVISTQGSFAVNSTTQRITVNIPSSADAVGLTVNGSVTAYFYKLETNQYELPFLEYNANGLTYYLQNGYLSFMNLQPSYYVYDLPARNVRINGSSTYAAGIERQKKQTLNIPVYDDPNPMQLVKTELGSGQIDKLSINLHSRMSKTTLKYDTE